MRNGLVCAEWFCADVASFRWVLMVRQRTVFPLNRLHHMAKLEEQRVRMLEAVSL